jgi:hypothetical protein
MLTKPVRDQHCVIGSLRRGLSDGVGVSRILWRGRNAWDRFEIFHRPHERVTSPSNRSCNSRQAQRSVNSAVMGQEPTTSASFTKVPVWCGLAHGAISLRTDESV